AANRIIGISKFNSNRTSLFIVFSSYFLNLMQDYYFSEKEKRKFEEKVRIPDESFNRPFQTFSKS
ncbi:hypothetical protein, partial [Phocaeicola dorei]|uniref:hypothetical protein n=1 Tax=Phocaeicola dorei TaxID=357276 RepID=UPI0019D55104